MAYMDQEQKSQLLPGIKKVLDKYGMKATVAVRDYSTLVVNLKSGPIDFWKLATERSGGLVKYGEHFQVNVYWYRDHYGGKARAFLGELIAAMNGNGAAIQNHDNSDRMTDYFDVGWYLNINVGTWQKPYQIV